VKTTKRESARASVRMCVCACAHTRAFVDYAEEEEEEEGGGAG
jgi:hypothetical protein